MFASRLKFVAALACGMALAPSLAMAASTATGDLQGADGAAHGTIKVTEAPMVSCFVWKQKG